MRKFVAGVLALVVALLGFTNMGEPSVQPAVAATSVRALPSWARSASIYEVNIRSFTNAGTFKAFKAHLPRLKKLGVKILWLMPIHPISETKRIGSLGSPYSVANYKEVNPAMGTDADFLALVKAAHAAGFKVVLDWVANHTGWDNVWMRDHRDWYTQNNAGVIQPPNQDWQDVADLNYSNADMRAAMIDAMKYWVTTFNIDGFRCDYANGVPTSFWEEATTQLDAIKPMFMLAESEGTADELNSAFNANYSWSLLSRLNSVANSGDPDASYLTSTLDSLTYTYANGSFPVTFITNHDQNSWNGTEYERLPGFVKRFSALYFTVPGMPLIYSGQEVGFNRRLQFFDKDSITWPKSSSMTAFYTKLVSLKTQNPALWNGSAGGELVQYDGTNTKVLTYTRQKGSSKVVVAINLGASKAKTTIDTGSAFKGTYFDYNSGNRVKVAKNTMTISVPAGSFVIYSTAPAK
jgi:glycosidase